MLVFILVFGTLILANPVQAGWFGDAVAQLIGWIVYAFVYVIGLLIMLVMWVLIKIAQYNDFINAEPVTYGWTIVRDVCNMFFILILLIIAFATILRVERYSFKTLLPKLILMAILINFSKLICGVFIDFTQVIMLTFVNGFKDIGTGNLTNMLGIDKIMSIEGKSTEGTGEVSAWSIVGAYMLALMYSVIALITLVTMVAVLAMRMIMIWVYVVLSPMAYLLSSFPAGEKYASQWWEEFSKNLIIGPILAFFIWLSFVSLGGVETPRTVEAINNTGKSLAESGAVERMQANGDASSTPSAGITEAGSPDHMIKFIISIAMLVGGLQISQQLGGQAGGMAGKGMAKMQKMGSGAMKSVGTGLKRATGVERVQMAYKAYKDTKASERSDRAKDDAVRANAVIGQTKQAVGKAGSTVMESVSGRVTRGLTYRTGRKVAEAKENVENIQKERADKTQAVSAIESELKRIGPKEDRAAKREAIKNDPTISGVVKADKLAEFDIDTNKIDELQKKKVELTAEIKVSEAEEKVEAKKIEVGENRQAKVDKWVNRGLGAVVGGGIGALTGNAILTMGGAFAGWKAKGRFDNAGQANLKRAVNYNNEKIASHKSNLKDSGKDKIMDVINKNSGKGGNKHEHAAATAIALEKGYFKDSQSAAEQKQKVHDRFKKDERVENVMNNAAEKHYIELSPPYSKLANAQAVVADKNSTPAQIDAARKEAKDANASIAYGLESGSVKISDLSASAINLAIDAIAGSMKDKSFQKQYDGASDTQKDAIKIALDNQIKSAENAGDHDTAYKAKKKLSYTEGFNMDRFGKSSDLSDPTQKRNHEQKKEFLASMNDSEAAKAVKSRTSRKPFLQEVQVHLSTKGAKINQNTTNEEIAGYLQDILPNVGLETMDSTSKAIISAVKNHVAPNNPPINPVV